MQGVEICMREYKATMGFTKGKYLDKRQTTRCTFFRVSTGIVCKSK